MKKILLSGCVILTFGIFAILQRQEENGENPSSLTIVSTSTPISMSSTKGAYKDGIYTGRVADALYGNIQVKATITNGNISDVVFLQYPNDRDTSIRISEDSMPILKQEAIQAQIAQVDIVSGATQTSQAFIESLQSALDQAK